jgi:uncharacterized protein
MDTEATRALIQNYYAAWDKFDSSQMESLLDESVVWLPPKSAPVGPVRGAHAVAVAIGGSGNSGKYLDVRTWSLQIHEVIVEGGTAVVRQAVSAKSHDGRRYANEYCWVYSCDRGKIVRIGEYTDGLKAARFLGW